MFHVTLVDPQFDGGVIEKGNADRIKNLIQIFILAYFFVVFVKYQLALLISLFLHRVFVGWPYFKLNADQISLLEFRPKLFCFFILDQVTINAAVTDTTLPTERKGVNVVIGAKTDSD